MTGRRVRPNALLSPPQPISRKEPLMAKAAARHILVSTEAKANELKTAIENGADFAQVAKKTPAARPAATAATWAPSAVARWSRNSTPWCSAPRSARSRPGQDAVRLPPGRSDQPPGLSRPAATAKRRQERSWRRFCADYCRAWNSAGSNGSRCSSTASAPTMSAYMPCANSASTWASSVARSGLAAGSSPPPNTPCRPRRCSGTPPSPAARAPDPATRHRRARPRSGGRGSWPSWAGS